jgi:signal transduction histidine kinase
VDDQQQATVESVEMAAGLRAPAETPGRRAVRLALRFGPLAVMVAGLVVLVLSGALKHLSLEELRADRHVLKAFVDAHPLLSVLAYVAVYVGAIALSLPAALILTVSGGFLFGPWLGGVAASVASTSGGAIVFLVSRLAVGDAVERRSGPRMRAIEEGIKKDAFFYLLTLRLIPVTPFGVVNVAAALLSIPLATFVVATFAGVLPGAVIYAGIGSGLGRLFDAGGRLSVHALITPQIALPLGALAVLSIAPILYQRMRGRRAAALAAQAGPGEGPDAEAAAPPRPRPLPAWLRLRRQSLWPGGLSARLLLLTALFVVLAELLILAPSLASYEEGRLEERVRAAELASLAVEASPDQVVTDTLASQLLNGAGVVSVAVQSDGIRRLLLQGPRMAHAPYLIDLRRDNPLGWLWRPFGVLTGDSGQMVRIVARPRFRDGDFVEIVAPQARLRRELWSYVQSLAAVTAFIGAVAGLLVYLSLNLFLVRPMQRITASMERFRANPDDPAARIAASRRRDEIGRAEAELDRMQADLRAALNSRARLAALGEAVAKINHDLRNMLTSAQIASERLAMSGDPGVAAALPRLERALNRAIALASDVLDYGKSEERKPEPAVIPLKAAIEAAGEDAGLARGGVRLEAMAAPRDQALADPEHLHRALVNLLRNGREAIEGIEPPRPGLIRVAVERAGPQMVLRIADNGPGLPERALNKLFQPFAGSARPGGTGLGLAISRELIQANGGALELVRTGPDGAVFELRLPAAG